MLTHMDDFLIISTDAETIMEGFKEKFETSHNELNPTSYLGLKWETSEIRKIKIHNQKLVKESMSKVESSLGAQLKNESTPTYPKNHPELKNQEVWYMIKLRNFRSSLECFSRCNCL